MVADNIDNEKRLKKKQQQNGFTGTKRSRSEDRDAREREKLALENQGTALPPMKNGDNEMRSLIGAVGVGQDEEVADYVVGIDAFRVPTREERTATRQNVIRLQQQARDAPLVEARILGDDKNKNNNDNSSKKTRYLLLALVAFVIVALVVIVPTVLITRRKKRQSSSSSSSTSSSRPRCPGISKGNETPTVLNTVPSSSPSISFAPTSAAFQDVVSLLGFDDILNEKNDEIPFIPENTNTVGHYNYRAIHWMAHQDQITPTLVQSFLSGDNPKQARSSALQRFALVSFFYATKGESWLDPLGFLNETQNECEWRVFGRLTLLLAPFLKEFTPRDQSATVNCINNTVVSISIDRNNLRGVLPETIGLLTKLSWLDLPVNDIGGSFPTRFFQMTQMRAIFLMFNRLTGIIPNEIGNLVGLEYIWARGNLIAGTIPKSVGNFTSMRLFDVGANLLSGTVPTEFQFATTLERLLFGFNMMTSTLPSELNSLQRMWYYEPGYNMMTGTMPFVEGSNPSLVTFDGPVNKFTGDLSPFVHLSSFRQLFIEDNPFTGTIPTEFCKMSITSIAAGANQFTGAIPNCIGELTRLSQLFIHTTPLTGTVPLLPASLKEMAMFDTQLSGPVPLQALPLLNTIYLGANNFTVSTIPPEFFNLTSLAHGTMNEVGFTGTIPTRIGEMTALTALRISRNKFTGPIPTEMGLLTKLQHFNVFRNNMTGTIPSEIGNLVRLKRLLLYFNDFTGTIPRTFLNMTSLRILSLFGTNLTDDVGFLCENFPPFESFNVECDRLTSCTCCTSCCDLASTRVCTQRDDDGNDFT